jgi:biopolymer transport protein ExbD
MKEFINTIKYIVFILFFSLLLFFESCASKVNAKCLTKDEITQLIKEINSNHNIELPRSHELSTNNNSTLKIVISEDNEYFFTENSTIPIDSNDLELQILSNIGKDSTIELYGDNKSEWKYCIAILDIIKKHGLKVIIKTNS